MTNPAKLAVINLPAEDPEQTSRFYADLLGIEFTRSPTDDTISYGAPLSDDGTYITIKRRERPEEGATLFLAVDSLDDVVASFEAAGGALVAQYKLPIAAAAQEEYARQIKKVHGLNYPRLTTMGSAAVVTDSEGNRIGLIEADQHAQILFRTGAYARDKSPSFEAAQEAARAIQQAHAKARSGSRQPRRS